MTEQEIQEQLKEISKNLKLFDLSLCPTKDDYYLVNERQAEMISSLIKLFRTLKWQIPFNNFKTLEVSKEKPIKASYRGSGIPVKVRSCKKEHGDKTYFGILIGDVALSISHSIVDDTVTASHAFYNPGIFVPELGEMVYGCESWWSEIESEEELNELITDETIQNVWYVKMLKNIENKNKGENDA